MAETKTKKQETISTLSWYDEFDVNIVKKEAKNTLAGRIESIIVGWDIVKKLHPKLIEPSLAKHLNSFANGYQPGEFGKFLFPKGEKTVGSRILYKEWADEMGINPKDDINQLLS
jgi:hypothetical protein